MPSTDWDIQRVARTALVIIVALAAVWTLWRFLPALAWACVLAIATWPLRHGLARRGMGRTSAALLLTLVLAVVLVTPLIAIGFEGVRDSHALAEWLRDVRQSGLGTPDWLSHIPIFGESINSWWQTNLAPPGAARSLLGRSETAGIFAFTRMLGAEVASRLTILLFTLLALFFIYRDGPGIAQESQVVANRLFGPPGSHLGRNAIAAVRGTVNGLVLVGFGEGVILGIAYWAVGMRHVVLLTLVTGVLAAIPFGAPLIFVFASLYMLATGHTTAFIVIEVTGWLVVFVADHFIRPILIGNSTRLPFVWVLLGIFGGLETFGLIGVFLGPAIMSVLIAIWREGAETPGASAA
ncbi:MAG TPA: AI-2E family transporter [Xanthobacteraceae bacterium]|jgi:predicted PurR-regulated permease PerM